MDDPLLGRRLAGKFEIESRLSEGAMGIVYRAKQTSLDKWVCVKVMHAAVAADPMLGARFEREARAASRLDHPNSLRVIDFGEEPDGIRYIVMEYLAGHDLAQLLDELGTPGFERTVDILSQALSALAVAHDLGIIHRDIKPENVMIVRGERDERIGELVKVCDFGIAKFEEPATSAPNAKLTTAGLVLGTPEYMSPEQARGAEIDARSDLYSVGVMLYRMLTGCLPFEAASPIDLALMHIRYEPMPPRELDPTIPQALEDVCLRALEKEPHDRFRSAREMREALRNAIGSRGSSPSIANRPENAPEERPSAAPTLAEELAPAEPLRRPRLVAAAACTLLAVPALTFACARGAIPIERAAEPIAVVRRALEIAPLPRVSDVTSTTTTPRLAIVSAPMAARHPLPTAPSSRSEAPPPPATLPDRPPIAESGPPHAPISAAEPVSHAPGAETAPASHAPTAEETAPALRAPIVAPSPPPEPPRYDVATARVDVLAPSSTTGATALAFERALGPAGPRISACWRDALPRIHGVTSAIGALYLETDDVGVITHARLDGPFHADLAACIAHASLGGRVANVDTGTASAAVPLVYRPR